jgi:hypothetical protein
MRCGTAAPEVGCRFVSKLSPWKHGVGPVFQIIHGFSILTLGKLEHVADANGSIVHGLNVLKC